MNGETEMCDLMEVIFENEEASKYTSILTAEDYDTIGDLAFTFDRPPSEEQMEKTKSFKKNNERQLASAKSFIDFMDEKAIQPFWELCCGNESCLNSRLQQPSWLSHYHHDFSRKPII